MAEFNEVYRRAVYYDIAFRRDVRREVGFVTRQFERRAGRKLGSVLELACGPGYHVREFVKAGVRAIGLDLRPEMTDFAAAEAAKEGVEAEWIAADMRGFRLDRPVDAIVTTYDSIDCLLTNADLIAHFRTVAANLAPDGIYLFELTHPRDCTPYAYGEFFYEGERDGVHVRIDWAVNGPKVDPLTQVAEVQTVMTVRRNGTVEQFPDRAFERFCNVQEYAALIELAGGLEIIGVWGDFDERQPFDLSPGSRRLILVVGRSR